MQDGTPARIVSRNESFGFFGTVRAHAEPCEAWTLEVQAIWNATGCSDEAVCAFLDSRYGRHFADEVVDVLLSGKDLLTGIERAVERWMHRRIDARIEDEVGIPQGLPYLTGFVCMHAALLETGG
jgi:hypothetical protein